MNLLENGVSGNFAVPPTRELTENPTFPELRTVDSIEWVVLAKMHVIGHFRVADDRAATPIRKVIWGSSRVQTRATLHSVRPLLLAHPTSVKFGQLPVVLADLLHLVLPLFV